MPAAQLLPSRTWQPGDHEVVGVVDHGAHQVVLDRAVEVDGVPVPLVLVVAGTDPGVRRSQLEGSGRVALETTAGSLPSGTSANILPPTFMTATSSPNG